MFAPKSLLRPSSLRLRPFHTTSTSLTADPYSTLSIPRSSSAAEIKRAYYDLAKKFHPDNSKGGEKEKFVKVQEAYDILSDPVRKAEFDSGRMAGQGKAGFGAGQAGFGAGFGAGQGFGQQAGFSGFDPEDILNSLFGNSASSSSSSSSSSSARGRSIGEDIEQTVHLSFTEACLGTQKSIPTRPIVDCASCHSSGLKPGTRKSTCKTCNGAGTISFSIQGGFRMARTCEACAGQGSSAPRGSECASCDGLGKVVSPKTRQVEIPPGVDEGTRVRVSGAGHAAMTQGKGSKPGDLVLRISVKPSAQFKRNGVNLFHSVNVPFHVAILGGKITVPTLTGEVGIPVPPGSQPGDEIKVPGNGVQALNRTTKGDLIVNFNVKLPRTLTNLQRELLSKYRESVEGYTSASNTSTSSSSSSPYASASSATSSSATDSSSPSASSSSEKTGSSTNDTSASSSSSEESKTGWLGKKLRDALSG